MPHPTSPNLFDTATSTTAAQIIPMTPGDKGVWSVTGGASWKNKFYLFDVEVYVSSTDRVEHNEVTDPYSLGLLMNSMRSMIVDLNDPALKPSAWGAVAKPVLAAPEDIKLYELHVREFSINDTTVPEAARGSPYSTLPRSTKTRPRASSLPCPTRHLTRPTSRRQ